MAKENNEGTENIPTQESFDVKVKIDISLGMGDFEVDALDKKGKTLDSKPVKKTSEIVFHGMTKGGSILVTGTSTGKENKITIDRPTIPSTPDTLSEGVVLKQYFLI
jgi:hypothetical protein